MLTPPASHPSFPRGCCPSSGAEMVYLHCCRHPADPGAVLLESPGLSIHTNTHYTCQKTEVQNILSPRDWMVYLGQVPDQACPINSPVVQTIWG